MRPTSQAIEDSLIVRIVDEAKQILTEVGIEVRGPALKERLLAHGLTIDMTGKRILFPPAVVDTALAAAPRAFTLYDRDGNSFTEIGGDKVHFVTGSSGLKVHDHRNDETRPPTTPTLLNISAWPTGWSISPISPPPFRRKMLKHRSPMHGGSISASPTPNGRSSPGPLPRMAAMMAQIVA